MSDSVREAFDKWERDNGYEMSSFQQDRWNAYQAATAAADAEWRGVVEALEYVEANYDGMNKAAIVRQALAQAKKLMGRK